MPRKSFSIHSDFYGELRGLTDAERGQVLMALICSASDDPIPDLDRTCGMLFRMMRSQMDRISAVNASNGAKGGAPHGNANAIKTTETSEGVTKQPKQPKTTETSEGVTKQPKQPKTTENKRNKPTVPDTVTNPVSVTDTDTVTRDNGGTPPFASLTAPKGGERDSGGRFIPPTVDDVAKYCADRNNGLDAEAFVAFYASKGWRVGKDQMKSWKQAIITWECKRREQAATGPRASPMSTSDSAKAVLDQLRREGIA